MNWLANGSRPDIATICCILSQYLHNAHTHHLQAAKRLVRYLKDTSTKGIRFSNLHDNDINAFIQYPLSTDTIGAQADACWGPQDASVSSGAPQQVSIFKSRSISGAYIHFLGPLLWLLKRQKITVWSSAESEIIAMDECVKRLQHIHNLIKDLDLHQELLCNPTIIKNDNSVCVHWSHSMTA